MLTLVQKIFKELGKSILSVEEITGFGSVNTVFAVRGKAGDYILRLNNDQNAPIEYAKEEWCLEQTKALGVPVPVVLKRGSYGEFNYLLQKKIPGVNGMSCDAAQQLKIWNRLGQYATRFHTIRHLDVDVVQEAEFHDNWLSKIVYNLTELHPNDQLVLDGGFTTEEQQKLIELLYYLKDKPFRTGLVHGDLCPRNVIVDETAIHLLDWGTAEVNIVPHTEIGIVLMNGEANSEEFQVFLAGMMISTEEYRIMEPDVLKLNVLHRLDKYRWASDHDRENLADFVLQLRQAYESVISLP